ncbi:integrase core domain-containing protein [Aureimonas altamirensis]|uniref:integrase core domain-containing protein n=1 Tax=Aureimonas altamirensis TaxID=370622 RepID=UPI003B97C50C
MRNEWLKETLFASLNYARSVLRAWRDDYKHVRSQSGISGLTPGDAAKRVAQPRTLQEWKSFGEHVNHTKRTDP